MKSIITLLCLCFSTLAYAEGEAIILKKSGSITLEPENPQVKEKLSITNELAELNFSIYSSKTLHQKYFRFPCVSAHPEIISKCDNMLAVTVNIAFLTSENEVICATTQSVDMKPRKKNQLGSCFTTAPAEEISKISKYQIVVYMKQLDEEK